MRKRLGLRPLATGLLVLALPVVASAMCGYFSRPIVTEIKQPAVLQPSQIAFITWDPDKQVETVTVQPRFEGNAMDFGMVIPTPSQPKLHEMPRDFFKALGVFTQPKKRVYPESKLLPQLRPLAEGFGRAGGGLPGAVPQAAPDGNAPRQSTVKVVEVGLVGNLDYKIITAERPDDLYTWLKNNKYSYDGDEATLDFYVQKKYYFTVMKIDTLQMKKNADGSYTGDVTPTKFTFRSEKLIYPLKITQVSVKDKTEALFYVQAPFKVDLPGDQSYQFHWLRMLQQVQQTMPADLLEQNRQWLQAVTKDNPGLIRRGQELGFNFPLNGEALQPNKDGHYPSSLEWAKKLTDKDIAILSGDQPYSEAVPDPDAGFTQLDLQDPGRAQAIFKVIQRRLEQYRQARPRGYLTRDASKEDVKLLHILKGHLQEGQILTKFDHTFIKSEMNDDLVMVPAKVGNVEDRSEHEELLRTLIFGGRGPRFPLPPGGGPGFPPPPGGGPVPLPVPPARPPLGPEFQAPAAAPRN